jgi:iduronate 2-sulfatase
MIDLYPTLSELAGLPVPAHAQGKSLVRLLDNPAVEVHDAVYTCIREDHLLTTSRWSYARYRDGSEELYDHDKDPRQFFNLAAEPAYASVLGEMRLKLDAKLAEIES